MIDRLEWSPLKPDEAKRLAASTLYGEERVDSLQGVEVEGRAADLPFYSRLRLHILDLERSKAGSDRVPRKLPPLVLLADEQAHFLLDGKSGPVHAANEYEGLDLDLFDEPVEVAADYLRFYCFAIRGDEGPFLLFERARPPDASPSSNGEAKGGPTAHGQTEGGVSGDDEDIAGLAMPLQFEGRDDQSRFRFRARVKYGSALFESLFAVAADGNVGMLDDDRLAADVPPQPFVTFPPLFPQRVYRAIVEGSSLSGRTVAGGGILRTFVEILLEHALTAQAKARLLAHFNAKLEGSSPLDRFAEVVATAAPVVAIEGSLPFVEDTVAQIVEERRTNDGRLRVIRPSVEAGDDTRISVSVPDRSAVVLLPFHAYRGLVDTERVAHDIASRDVACLIGCERVGDLPESIGQVVDLVLPLPRLDASLFETLFERVTGQPPPEGWQEEGTHWVTHVHHSDFQHPQGLSLDSDEAFAFVRDRARERLRDVEPESGLGLADLHGMAEARAFAEDLITDIHEAIAGRLAWEHVDRGVLLVGPPGTGKTTLARAVAKDCGIRFVNASAASWQAAGYLGDHIRALRRDFALARRYAPSILFIDEIDSVGNRETFSGKNAQYSIQVVNALLEQLQGMDPKAPVIVIAATNYADRVDPALRRAGRLDRTIEIPRPNTESLADIFAHYLDEYVGEERADDIDLRALGGLAFGLTGADVEFFVRGALRRARRAGRPVRHADLVAEVTRKPRDPDALPRLTPEEVRRVAVHEAGHALASFLTDSGGEDLTYVSIIPRSNGTLGFAARMPSEQRVVTRRQYLERLEVVLSGRAAEEVVFGSDDVSGGARHDLKVATKSALLMTTQYGLGPDRDLLWSDTPSASQREDASRILNEAYATVLSKLRANSDTLRALAEMLEDQQELTGDEARALLRTPRGA